MKARILMITLMTVAFSFSGFSQMEKRKSPAAEAKQTVGKATITINYSQPSMKGREIYGGLVPYGEVWRTGANEATTIETDKNLMIDGKELPAGKYALFTIPGEKEWTIIINKVHDQWGAYKYNPDEDVMRFKAKPKQHAETEMMSFSITKDGDIHLDWAETRVSFSVKA